MKVEIERKYLVKGEYKVSAVKKYEIKQGYISTDPNRTVRIRTRDKEAFITIKGRGNESGMSRMEWEQKIPYADALDLLKLCNKPLIEKVRYIIKHDAYIIEVDEFIGDNGGLVLAEIELKTENDILKLPNFIGDEVTGDKKYYNSYLSKHPYISWQ